MLGLILPIHSTQAQPARQLPTRAPTSSSLQQAVVSQPRYVPGQFLVKYKPSLTQCAHCLFALKQPFRQATSDGSSSLDALHARFGVTKITPVFRTEEEEHAITGSRGYSGAITQAALQSAWVLRVDVMKRRFSTRSARAPQGATPPDLSHVYLVEVSGAPDIEQLCKEYRADPHVEYAHPNYLAKTEQIPDDPYYHSSGSWGQPYEDLWGLHKIHAEEAWESSQGNGVTVAVIDTGVDVTHEDFVKRDGTPNLTPGYDFVDIPADVLEDWRAADALDPAEDYQQPDADPADHNGHGTHVAGTIAAAGFNGKGIIGVAPQAKIMPLRAGLNLKTDGNWNGTLPSLAIAQAINYAITNGADVINMSFGGGCQTPSVEDEALNLAYASGLVLVAAAGNEAQDISNVCPASNPTVISVGATDEEDRHAPFSNFGMKLDLSAPGGSSSNILSLRSGQISVGGITETRLVVGDHYLRLAGTSMAAPHVSGVVALMLAHHAHLLNEEVGSILRATADDVL